MHSYWPTMYAQCIHVSAEIHSFADWFLQRARIARNAERCNSYGNSVCLSVRHTLVPYPDE